MKRGLCWHGPEDVLEIGTFRLAGPLVYSAPGKQSEDTSAIIMGLPVEAPATHGSARGPFAEQYPHLSFYPSYHNMSSSSRWRYLEWLAAGRPMDGSESYQLQFLKGLERRVMVDGKDVALVWSETWKLWSECAKEKESLRYAANQFLWFLLLQVKTEATPQQLEVLARVLTKSDSWNPDGDRNLSLLVGWCAHTNGTLPLWMAYHAARVSHDAKRTVVVSRAEKELRRFFALRFREAYGNSIPLQKPTRARRYMDYIPLNKSLRPSRVTWADPVQVRVTWRDLEADLVAIYNRCLLELRPLALALGRDGGSRRSVAAWEATPAAVRRGEHPALEDLWKAGGARLREGGSVDVKVKNLFGIFEVPPAHGLTLTVSKKLAASLRLCGMAVEPDAGLSRRTYRAEEAVVLFLANPDQQGPLAPITEAMAERYSLSSFLMLASFWVRQSGNGQGVEAMQAMAGLLNARDGWEAEEISRYRAFARLVQLDPPTTTSLKVPTTWNEQRKRQVGEELRQFFGRFGPLGHRDGMALATVEKKLGQKTTAARTDWAGPEAHAPVLIGLAVPGGAGELLPPPPFDLLEPLAPLQLDHSAVQALMEETRHVQAALALAMAESELVLELELEPEATLAPDAGHLAPPELPSNFPGLDERYEPLLKLWTAQENWPLGEVRLQARDKGLMLAGAVEAINDWSIEALGGVLLYEEGEVLHLERDLLE